jgi:hypothetical protein
MRLDETLQGGNVVVPALPVRPSKASKGRGFKTGSKRSNVAWEKYTQQIGLFLGRTCSLMVGVSLSASSALPGARTRVPHSLLFFFFFNLGRGTQKEGRKEGREVISPCIGHDFSEVLTGSGSHGEDGFARTSTPFFFSLRGGVGKTWQYFGE